MTARPETVDYERLAVSFEAVKDGHTAAWDDLIVALTPVLWHVARAQGVDRELSADVVQTAWLALVGALPEIRDPRRLTSWLITVTKREAWRVLAERRSTRTLGDQEVLQLPDPGPQPDEDAVEADRRVRLWAAVNRMPSGCRTLLRIAAFVHRPDYNELSAALGMKRGSIGPTRRRCLDQLRSLLSAWSREEW
jgi:RNA polymerase sigma factor (sigma-70 family)